MSTIIYIASKSGEEIGFVESSMKRMLPSPKEGVPNVQIYA
jgi:hypothetical protein